MTGIIARIVSDRGFGFITPDDGSKDVFFHARSLVNAEFDDVREGDKVTFDMENGPKGPAAANVERVEGGESAPAEEAPAEESTEEAA